MSGQHASPLVSLQSRDVRLTMKTRSRTLGLVSEPEAKRKSFLPWIILALVGAVGASGIGLLMLAPEQLHADCKVQYANGAGTCKFRNDSTFIPATSCARVQISRKFAGVDPRGGSLADRFAVSEPVCPGTIAPMMDREVEIAGFDRHPNKVCRDGDECVVNVTFIDP
jgi:hypothetical protein